MDIAESRNVTLFTEGTQTEQRNGSKRWPKMSPQPFMERSTDRPRTTRAVDQDGGSDLVGLKTTTGPVSYTHLDVYKRQRFGGATTSGHHHAEAKHTE